MSKLSVALISILCVTLGAGCGNSDAVGPQVEVPLNATVTANLAGGWSPEPVLVKAGGTVTWIVPSGVSIPVITLNPFKSNEESLIVINGSVTHAFPTAGTFSFCAGTGCPPDVLGSGSHTFSLRVLN